VVPAGRGAAKWVYALAPKISSEPAGLAAGSSTSNSVPPVNPTKVAGLDSAIACERFFSTAMIKSGGNLR
jgi:hypothetical protein